MKKCYINLLLVLALFSCGESESKKKELIEPLLSEAAEPDIPENAVRFTVLNNHFYVEAVIQDSIPATLILDTGSVNGLDLDSAFVRKSGLIAPEYYEGDQKTFAGRAKYIRGLNSLQDKALLFKLNHLTDTLSLTNAWDLQRVLKHNKADGILGMTFMENFIMEINYEKGYFVFHEPNQFTQPANTEAVPINYEKGGLFMEVEYHVTDDYKVKEETRIDIGYGSDDIGFCSYAARRLNLLERVKDKVPGENWGSSQTREEATGFTGKMKSITMGGLVIDSPEVRLYTSKRGITAANQILLGNYILSRYKRVIFDFGNNNIYIDAL